METQNRPSVVLMQVTTRRTEELFDPRNAGHMAAFVELNSHGRQSPTIRFKLEFPYLDVRSLMLSKIAAAYIADARFTKPLSTKRTRELTLVK